MADSAQVVGVVDELELELVVAVVDVQLLH